jgi:hypothetical protein
VAALAQDLVQHFRGFEGARVVAFHPIEDPDGNIDFWEAQLQKGDGPAGYVMLSATQRNYPIVEMSPGGESHFGYFSKKVGAPFHMMRFGSGYLAALSDDGQVLAEVGDRPRLLPDECRPSATVEGRSVDGQELVHPNQPSVPSCAAVKEPSIQELKTSYARFLPSDAKALAAAWKRVRSAAKAAPAPQGLTTADTKQTWSDGTWNYYFANGYDYYLANSNCGIQQDITYFTQMPPNSYPNTTDNYSGCGPTAWMNLFGWWSRHGRPGVLQGPHLVDDSYIDFVTMDFNDLLNVHGGLTGDDGNTFTWDIANGYQWISQPLSQSGFPAPWYDLTGYWYRYGTVAIDYDWVYEVGRDSIITNKTPLVVAYASDSHITVAYGLAELTTGWQNGSYLWINPGWHISECQYGPGNGSKWIYKDDLRGLFEVSSMRLVRDSGFENDPSTFPSDPNGWQGVGAGASFRVESGVGTASSGSNNGLIVLDKAGHSGLQKLRQAVTVEPYRHYRLTAMVRTGTLSNFGVIAINDPTAPSGWGFTVGSTVYTTPQYQVVSVDFSPGNTNYVEVMAALWSDGTANSSQWMRIDDVNVWLMDSLEDGDFELQPAVNQAVSFPWKLTTSQTTSGGISSDATQAHSGGRLAWIYSPACSSCVPSSFNYAPGQTGWSEFGNVISVSPNTNYQVTAWVNAYNTPVTVGVTDLANGYPSTLGGKAARQVFSLPSGYQQVTFNFNSGNNEMLRLYFGYTQYQQFAWMHLDQVVVRSN